MTDESERKVLLNPLDAAKLPPEWQGYVEVSPDVPAGTAYVFTLPPMMWDEPVHFPVADPRARCTVTDLR